jgi:adenylate kinase family enzyme
VVMSGPAAGGKTTLARALAAELDLPLLAKDIIKTAITSVFGRLTLWPHAESGRLPSPS